MRSIITGLIMTFLSVLFPVFAFAQTADTTGDEVTAVNEIVFSNVNFSNTKIISQQGNKLNLSFDIDNRGTTAQSDIRYGVKLIKEASNGAQVIVDSFFATEVLAVNSEKTLHKEFVYTASPFLSGQYTVYVIGETTSGFPLGVGSAGKITLSSTGEGLEIIPESCVFKVEGNNDVYNLVQGVDVDSTETLSFSCSVRNNLNKATMVVPEIQTYERTAAGQKASTGSVEAATVSFVAKETKQMLFTVPKPEKPQAYDVKLTLSEKGTNAVVSNTIIGHYVLRGTSATIQNASFDKTSYEKGENLTVHFYWTPSADQFVGSRKGEGAEVPTVIAELNIADGKGVACAPRIIKNITPYPSEVSVSGPVASTCLLPKVSIRLLDENGSVLDSKVFTSPEPEKTLITQAISDNTTPILLILSVLIAIILLLVAKKVRSTPTLAALILVSAVFSGVLLGGTTTEAAKAATTAKAAATTDYSNAKSNLNTAVTSASTATAAATKASDKATTAADKAVGLETKATAAADKVDQLIADGASPSKIKAAQTAANTAAGKAETAAGTAATAATKAATAALKADTAAGVVEQASSNLKSATDVAVAAGAGSNKISVSNTNLLINSAAHFVTDATTAASTASTVAVSTIQTVNTVLSTVAPIDPKQISEKLATTVSNATNSVTITNDVINPPADSQNFVFAGEAVTGKFEGKIGYVSHGTKITVASANISISSTSLNPGDSLSVTGAVLTGVCNNHSINMTTTAQIVSGNPDVGPVQTLSGVVTLASDKNLTIGETSIFSNGTLTVPTAPGTYYVAVTLYSKDSSGQYLGIQYLPFTVTGTETPVTPTTPGTTGGTPTPTTPTPASTPTPTTPGTTGGTTSTPTPTPTPASTPISTPTPTPISAVCGDNSCSGSETPTTCPQDCNIQVQQF